MRRIKNSRLLSLLATLRQGNSFGRTVIVLLALGVLVRVVLMPIAFHPDLFWVTYHAQNLALHGQVTKDMSVQPIPLLLYSATIWVFQGAFSPTELIWPDAWSMLSPEDYQGAFALAHVLGPWSLVAWRLVVCALDLATLALVVAILRKLKLPVLRSIVYWWNPLVVKELFNSAHMDVIVLPFVLGAVLLSMHRKLIWAAACLALGVGTK